MTVYGYRYTFVDHGRYDMFVCPSVFFLFFPWMTCGSLNLRATSARACRVPLTDGASGTGAEPSGVVVFLFSAFSVYIGLCITFEVGIYSFSLDTSHST